MLWFTSTIQIDNNGIKFNREICSTQLLITHWKCNEMWTNWLTKAFGRLSTRQLLTYIIITTTTHLFLTWYCYYTNIIQIIQLCTYKTIIKSVKKLSYQWNDQEQWNEKFETKQTKTYLWILYILTVNGKNNWICENLTLRKFVNKITLRNYHYKKYYHQPAILLSVLCTI